MVCELLQCFVGMIPLVARLGFRLSGSFALRVIWVCWGLGLCVHRGDGLTF